MRAPVGRLTVVDSPARLAALRRVEGDLRGAGAIAEVVYVEGPEAGYEVDLAQP
jgi:hypothetical protein